MATVKVIPPREKVADILRVAGITRTRRCSVVCSMGSLLSLLFEMDCHVQISCYRDMESRLPEVFEFSFGQAPSRHVR